MIELRKISDLELSAASGLVADGERVLVVADDQTHLDAYDIATGRRLGRISLLERVVPSDAGERKASKADFEALSWLPDGRLLVLGSGSTAHRQTAVLLMPASTPNAMPIKLREFDIAGLYDALRARFGSLNVEGAALANDSTLRLLSRGGVVSANLVIDLDAGRLLRACDDRSGAALGGDVIRSVMEVELGALDGIPLGFTDAAPIRGGDGRIAFSAAAENTANAYDDGPCAGSVVGVLELDGTVSSVHRVEGHHKIEGLVVRASTLLMVADPDDPSQRAPFFAAESPRELHVG